MENANREFITEKVETVINEQEELHDWEFVYMGANMDTVEEGKYHRYFYK